MATSAEQLQDAIDSVNNVASAFNGKNQAIDNKVNALIPSVAGALVKTINVDPAVGDDNAEGSSANPVKSLSGAANLMVSAGVYSIILHGNVVVDSRIVLRGTSISISSSNSASKRRIDWANQIDGVNTSSPVLFLGNLLSVLNFSSVILGNVASAAHVTNRRMIEGRSMSNVSTFSCDFDTQAGHDLPFVFTNGQLGLWMLSAMITAQQSGLWLNGVAAGTDPATEPRILNTNLASL